jgi:phosphoglycerol transferase MdoB-like AlkP superfamily enzyme
VPRALLRVYLLALSVTTLGRLALFCWQHGRLDDIPLHEQLLAFVHGLRMDTIALSYLLIVPALALCLVPSAWGRVAARGLRVYVLLALVVLVFLEIATFPFFAEYDVRPNILFVAYLEYPREVASMLWKEQKLGLALQFLAIAAIVVLFQRRRVFASFETLLARPWSIRARWFLPMACVVFLGIRSSFGHRPANLSDAAYSNNRVAGEIAKNSLFSVAYEAYRGRNDGQRLARQYGSISMADAYGRVNAMLLTAKDDEHPFLRTVAPRVPVTPPRNLVVVIQESMGAQFVGHLGDSRGLTPCIDRLANEGLTFLQLYANGTRSIRGLAAMSAGFQPLLGDGVLKRPKSQSGFFSLASLLEPHGYQTSFIYGGEARFDNMRGWYLGNGFDRVIEERDYEKPAFRSTWGVSDEDLLHRANELYREQHAEGRPFASVVFTSSNHTPFELPDGRIEWAPGVERASVENAIKYADYAVGQFFDAARAEPYFANTVFVIVADHNVRVVGDDVIPVHGFHIPGLILGPGIEPKRHAGLTSQPDLLATALGELGLELRYPILGNSIFREERRPFVMMQFNDTYGFRRDNQVAVLRANLPVETFDVVDGRLHPAPHAPELELDGLALLHVTEDLYERKLYR